MPDQSEDYRRYLDSRLDTLRDELRGHTDTLRETDRKVDSLRTDLLAEQGRRQDRWEQEQKEWRQEQETKTGRLQAAFISGLIFLVIALVGLAGTLVTRLH